MRIEIAQNVIEHLRKFPFGFPKSRDNDEWKLFEVPLSLTDEEGELLSKLMPYSEHIDDIQKEYDRLLKMGVVFKSSPTKSESAVFAIFDDTCGNLIVINQVMD